MDELLRRDEPSGDALAELALVLPDAVVVVDADGSVCWANPAAERLVDRSLVDVVGRSGLELVHPDDLGLAAAALGTVQGKQAGTPIELRLARPDGWRLVEVVGAPLGAGKIVLVMRDLTERRCWEVAGDETARFRSVLHNAASMTMLLDADGIVHSVSGAITRQLGHDPERICGRSLFELTEPTDHHALTFALGRLGQTSSTHPGTVEVQLVSVDGRLVPFELSIVSLLDDPSVRGVVVSAHDISRLRAAQQALEQLAAYDSLTGLANRRTFDAALEREWALSHRDGIDSFVLVADLDGFKRLNDDHGHAAGDEALRQFSRLLRRLVRGTDVVARLGGDEFAVILVRCGTEAAAIGLTTRLQRESATHDWPGEASLGVSTGSQSLRRASTPGDALHRADVAMLANKPGRALRTR
jgi:diguanylate cyclase (GGDEF)-like protein/PAS domain S-box-containing protein